MNNQQRKKENRAEIKIPARGAVANGTRKKKNILQITFLSFMVQPTICVPVVGCTPEARIGPPFFSRPRETNADPVVPNQTRPILLPLTDRVLDDMQT